ncbi:erythrocyte membrane protein 1, PfEMP1, putative [Plasmodium reichenowi]|uniref:Erythrocyte membrane protein 1, PfEMP1, putative n=1 Tax=Plasmodium reichenowi TaxID=5854 RepID=A0A2P9DT71_PLARE|nr:erythrocyte membrane protein 1, PfEMP1, putative [Plasmodium reichenowi]
MGNTQSTPSVPEDVKNESEKSARNVLENIAQDIKQQAKNSSKKYESQLKGKLEKASFKGAYGDWSLIESYGYSNPCYLNYIKHTNILYSLANDRNPCLFSPSERFSIEGEAECNGGIITGNKGGCGACAPYRRRHICDKNLEALTVGNTKNSDDLLGNILVTAKYEGDSIVKKHPNRGSSEVCTALARSFADIGDIVRGKDMFKPNEQDAVQKGLRAVFQKIYESLPLEAQTHYADKDKSGNYYKLREDWWMANRDKVWKAITCEAPNDVNYFRKKLDNTIVFTSQGKCGHYEDGKVPTNLDYVPQFLRWFEEWAEHFCLVRKYKLEKVKKECRDERNHKYCSLNGYDCTKTLGKIRHFIWDNKCTGCSVKCIPYDLWLKNERKEFEKQTKKYEKEIKTYESDTSISNSNINMEYNKEFYEEFKKNYKGVDDFLQLLNEGRYCKEQLQGEEKIDFTKTGYEKGTFYRSQYCQVCPDCGVECSGTTCKPKEERYPNCDNNEIYSPRDAKTTEINVTVSGNEQGDISKKLEHFCSDENNENGKNYQKWQCYYMNENNNNCEMKSTRHKDHKQHGVISFYAFFDLWVRNLLIDTINWENDLKKCINNTGVTDCNDGCNSNCICFGKWVKTKENEWENVKKVFENKNISSNDYYNKLNGLFEGFFFQVMNEFNKDEAKWKELKQKLEEISVFSKGKTGTVNSEASIKVLFDHLKEKSTICKDNNTNEGCETSKNGTRNPCGKNTEGSKVVNVKQIAQYYKRQAHKQLNERGGRSKLKGDASKGQYYSNGKRNGSTLNGQICNINGKYSNARNGKSNNPCEGKGNGFKIGEEWKTGNSESSTPEVYIRPRRRHMCTSNLEYLIHNKVQTILNVDNGKINHAFLGDVLLAAKKEAEKIKDLYQQNKRKPGQNGLTDDKTVCRALKSSFADIADIIRGRDMWDKNRDEIKTQGNLIQIFGKIKEEIKKQLNGKLNGKYNSDTDGKHTQLRSDWWEANRSQVWEAMKCATNGVDITCDSDHTPLDDYIPQRLRWMTEWAEWYCKIQKEEYNKLVGECKVCKNKGANCINGDGECNTCKAACAAYWKKIEPWKKQWDKIRAKYQTLYSNALVDIAANGGLNTSTALQENKEKPVIEFLFELYKENGGKVRKPAVARTSGEKDTSDTTPTAYSTADGYVHQEATMNCEKQTQFCEKKNGSTSSDGKEDKEYAFKNPPNGYDEACKCNTREKPQPPPPPPPPSQEGGSPQEPTEKSVDVCSIVDGILKAETEKKFADACALKYGKNAYHGWKCNSSATKPGEKKSEDGGAVCIPPRRQKLYVKPIESLVGTESRVDLQKAFIESAAVETFFSWNEFKKIKEKEDIETKGQETVGYTSNVASELDKDLKKGEIPEEFKRQMFYTLGDYRDILFGDTKIVEYAVSGTGNKSGNEVMDEIESKINSILPKNGKPGQQTDSDKKQREEFWGKYAKDIWQGMLCSLKYKENEKDKKIEEIEDAHGGKELFDTLKEDNNYENVAFDASDTQALSADADPEAAQGTKLKDFVKRPTFFRWLEEWGEEFCKKRTDKLKQIKVECRGKNGNSKVCSGYGEDCKDQLPEDPSTFPSFKCPGCGKHCSSYRKWIGKKKTEYEKQKNAYNEQRNSYQRERNGAGRNNDDNGFCTKLQKWDTAAAFLKKLGSCKTNDESGKVNKIFDDEGEAFGHKKYCDPCSEFKVNCQNGNCGSSANGNTCPNNKITENHINYSTEDIGMLVIDNDKNVFDGDLSVCNGKDIFKGIKKEEWTCGKVCGYNVCKPKKVNGKTFEGTTNGEKQIIFIRALFKIWLEYFLEDYNKIIHKISHCTKSENKSTCIRGCNDKCNCVKAWITKKKEEWKKIKNHYLQKKHENGDNDIKSLIKNFLQELDPQTEVLKAIGSSQTLENYEDSKECNGADNLQNGQKRDIIDCLLENLGNEATSCQTNHKPRGSEQCTTPTTTPDDPDTSEDKQSPQFCPNDMPEPAKTKTDSDILCDDKKQPKCDNFKTRFSNSKCETKKNLIGLNAHNRWGGRDYPNIYVSPRVQQLCLKPLQDLKENTTEKNKLIEALKTCAYNEAKLLYEYYNGEGKEIIPTKNLTIKDEDIKQHTLEAMKRSYADYGNIVKGDCIWDYENKDQIDPKIMNFAKIHNISTRTSSVSTSGDDDVNRRTLWESIRAHVWKAMICGYENVGGSFVTEDVKCKLPDTEKTDQFFRWFVEWGENFCIRREQELKELRNKCNNVTCNDTHEVKKTHCENACKKYRQILIHFKKQYEKQKEEYEIIKSSIREFRKKDAMIFLKEKCNSKCLCFKEGDNYTDKVLKNVPDDVKDKCPCKAAIAPEDPFKDLNECPNKNTNNDLCNNYKRVRMCVDSKYRNSLEYWYGRDILIPSRRTHLCLRNITHKRFYRKGEIRKFKNDLLYAASSEAKILTEKYEDKQEALQAIKYTFADIGDIIKGKDMVDNKAYQEIKSKLENVLETRGKDSTTPQQWWEQNKKHVWNVMLCGYKLAGGKIEPNDCSIPSEESTDQFLRWLREWGTQYCKEKQQIKSDIKLECKSHLDKYGIIENTNDIHPKCLEQLKKYEIWSNKRLSEWDGLSKKFTKDKENNKYNNVQENSADTYLKQKCSECKCSFKDIEQTHEKSKKGGYDIYIDTLDKAQIPGFVEDTAYKYKGLKPECPKDNECSQYENIPCSSVSHDDDNDWNSSFVKDNKKTNMGVLLPPRRRQLCLRIDVNKFLHLRNDINNLKNFIFKSAFAEAKRLKRVYDDNDKLLQAMKYSFSDIGNVVKGDDMMESKTSEYMDKIFKGRKYTGIDRKNWWNENKYHVWESMLCGYRQAGGDTSNSENCRFPDIEPVPQFLRWFQEWTKIFCIRRKKLYENMVTACMNAECDKNTGNVESVCIEACEKYKYYVLLKKQEYDIQKNKYDAEFKNTLNDKDAPEFLKVPCLSQYFNNSKNWDNPYDTFDDKNIKDKCDCKKIETPPPPTPPVPDSGPTPTPPPRTPDELPLFDEPFDPTILQTTIPFGIALALGSIAFLYLKKKTKSPVDLLRVLDIHKGEYGMSTKTSPNRYIPYKSAQYKGKTYIYMEGDSGDEKYAFMSDTTDVTSSESEYEEMDINDIYATRAPKYKTLIEVVLEPSGKTQSDIQCDNTHTNKPITDEEWNELKQHFISGILENAQKDLPKNNISVNTPMNTQPNTLYFDNPEEKSFIMSIHDRDLYTGEEISYNINMSTNTNNDIPISSKNDVYSGIDLINDSLSCNKHIDIYDELLKRKENELFGTNHTKNTSNNCVAKLTNSDPIHNQINLLHKWLDRHRDMCEKWDTNNKVDILNHLKEEWENETHSDNIPSDNNIHSDNIRSDTTPSSNKMLNTDVSIEIDMDNPKPINIVDSNPDNSFMDNMEDDIYYDVNDDNNNNNNNQPSVDDIPMDHNKVDVDVPKKVHVEMKILNNISNGSLEQQFPISDVWNI